LELNPANATLHYYRGVVYASMGQPEKAIADLERYLEMQPFGQNSVLAEGLLDELRSE
jgi:regulator of sirC expression with transglutaminase-like and TPR domain